MVYYRIEHHSRFHYDAPVRESLMELRMRPRDEWSQSVLQFALSVSPRTRTTDYYDWLGNRVHYFNLPAVHTGHTVIAESITRLEPPPPLPPADDGWSALPMLAEHPDTWDMLQPSFFARPTEMLEAFLTDAKLTARRGVLQTVHDVTRGIHDHFDYTAESTHADSPIDEALGARAGVCQDFAHIMIAACRTLGIPARYVSGYLHSTGDEPVAAATHAWAECMIPGYGWAGFDPTTGGVVGEDHIRTAIGRDYADVPPTRGVYRGQAQSRVEVRVVVERLDEPPVQGLVTAARSGWTPPDPPLELPEEPAPFAFYAQQMQQQQAWMDASKPPDIGTTWRGSPGPGR